MKEIVIILFLILSQNFIYSQKIVIANKQWEGANFQNPEDIYNSKFRSNEENIDGKKYRELTYKVEGGWFEGVKQYYREEDNKVYRLFEGEERVILDFTLEVGDTIQVSNDAGEKFDFVPYRTSDTIIQNKIRRKLEMRGYPVAWTTNNPEKHVWIEGVGDTGFFFGSGEVYGNIIASPIYCVREGGYIYGAGMFCPNFVLITDVEDKEFETSFRYNRLSKRLYLDSDKIKQIDIYSITGIKLNSFTISGSYNEIDISMIDLPLCVVVVFDGKEFISKILKI